MPRSAARRFRALMFFRLVQPEAQPFCDPPRIHRFFPQDRPFLGFLLSLPSVRTHRVHLWLDVRAFPGSQVLCPMLTPAGSTGSLDTAFQYPWRIRQASPGKGAAFPSIYPPHLPSAVFGSKDFALLCKLIQLPLASYVVPVRQAGGLPPASFRFCVAADTLALS
jgi:hypothetical protein